jgi:hypothetical protein
MRFRWVVGDESRPFLAATHGAFFDQGLAELAGLPRTVNLHLCLPVRHRNQWSYVGWVSGITPEVWDQECYRLWNKAVRLYRGYADTATPEVPELFPVGATP